ncbi:cob(I)yrinic acid a,c-diamide adenosyltransferase [Candidatus Poribacteria bacterium]|nr:cob(I)yrinic acid a,c-diamide adenosyltransferase [Candidatus Poribacteria bacterium]
MTSGNNRPREGNRITRVYTKSGDDGTTGLVGGTRVSKAHPRLDAYGTVDELSSALGLARAALEGERGKFNHPAGAETLAAHLGFLQNHLFTLGGDLATPRADRHPMMPVITGEHIAYLESVCDSVTANLPPLRDFVLPGGTRTSSALHLARTICRRAERIVARVPESEELGTEVVIYLNRLSDALFVLARWANKRMVVEEPVWQRDMAEPPMPAHLEGTE